MKELDYFTVERLQAIAEPNALVFPPSHAEAAALARIALAAKEAGPVAFRVGERLFCSLYAAGGYASEMKLTIEPLYLEAMPNSPELPDGWKLMPIAPTPEMEKAISDGIYNDLYTTGIYADLLAAAPTAPTTEKQDGEKA